MSEAAEATRDMRLPALHDSPVVSSRPAKRAAPLTIALRQSGDTALRVYFNDGAEVLRSTTNGVYVCIGRDCRENRAYHTCKHVEMARAAEDQRQAEGVTD